MVSTGNNYSSIHYVPSEKINLSLQMSRGWPRPISPPSTCLVWTKRISPLEGRKRRRARKVLLIQVSNRYSIVGHVCARLTEISLFFGNRFKRRQPVARGSACISGQFDWKSRSQLPPIGRKRCQRKRRRRNRGMTAREDRVLVKKM